MRVRVWISGEDGPAHDFELPAPPGLGERIAIAVGRETEEGTVISVSWHLQGVERLDGDISMEGEPIGSVTIVHVICSGSADIRRLAVAAADRFRSEILARVETAGGKVSAVSRRYWDAA